ncbi:DUF3667 domain-containing protein [Oleiagrimonas citrea]|uniref:DUF3667 domain-containing protein n=1 Tax=Oleiagrimonas citrea TaxID=1665687 RepID=A0A846ZLQ9_9GAMM|nr:DUF3667 domain-containing protein [Oleiagrimonas citrea]NKZ38470.1 DUF3667 domain-containing protein [Oleiagrimonas citrea]
MQDIKVFEGAHCTNCGEPLQGAYCHRCGQSVHSVLRPMHGLVEETVETVLHIDSRILHTVPKLFLKPGFLTLEYFAGRRIRYIAPFRLMFVLCLLTFFALHWSVDNISTIDSGLSKIENSATPDTSNFADAHTPEQVRQSLQKRLQDLDQVRQAPNVPTLAIEQIDRSERILRKQANQRLSELGAPPLPVPATSSRLPATTSTAATPASQEADSDTLASRIEANWKAFAKGNARERSAARRRMTDGVFGTLPQALLLMAPLFALLLKVFYLFKRRLYMEHLIVAMHSHAFLFLSVLLITGVGLLSHWLTPHAAWLEHPLSWLMRALLLWIPIYLLWMQKRVYRQGWPATIWKFLFIGTLYSVLLTTVVMVGVALGMAH